MEFNFDKLIDGHWKHCLNSLAVKKGTVKNYNIAMKKFTLFFSDRPFTKENLELYIQLFDNKKSLRTLQHDMTIMGVFLGYLVKKKVLQYNWVQAIEKPYNAPLLKARLGMAAARLSVGRLLAASEKLAKPQEGKREEYYALRGALIVRLFAETGARLTELGLVKWADWQGAGIVIGKNRLRREITVSKETQGLIDRYYELSGNLGYLEKYFFVSMRHNVLSDAGLLRAFNQTVEKCGLPDLSPHMLRKAFIKKVIKNAGRQCGLRSYRQLGEYLDMCRRD